MDQAVPQCTTAPWQNDFVQKTVHAFSVELLSDIDYRLKLAAHVAAKRPGLASPLEVAFAMAWAMYSVSADRRGTCGAVFALDPQHEVLDYRVDFRVVCQSHPSLASQFPKIAIELDGHEFHEKTKEQVAKRNGRDRALMLSGWRVIRFSGSEFYRKPYDCIEDAWTQADFALADLVHAEWAREEGRS